MTAANKDLIKFTRSLLSEGASGFRARALGLYLTYLRGRDYTRVESRLDQSTYFRHYPLGNHISHSLVDEYEAAGFCSDGELPERQAFFNWLEAAATVIKPITPRVKKIRPSNKGADRAAE